MDIYNTIRKKIFDGGVNLPSDTIKVILVTTSYTPNLDTHEFLDDVNTNELANGTGYTTGGVTLSNKATTVDTSNDQGVFDCDNPSWTFSAEKSFRYAIFYKDSGSAATSPVISIEDLGTSGNITVPVGSFTLQVHANGLLRN